ncbi:MAG: hypothetical protein IKE70_02975 [Bacilli bacterium]|nr:hypothetical protein [Bacilli bacterium]
MRNKVDNCYSCGSNDFYENEKDKILIIKTPKEGFKISTIYEEEQLSKYKKYKKIGLLTLPIYFLGILMIWFPLVSIIYFYIVLNIIIITLFMLISGFYGENHYKKEIRRLNKLKYNGTLVKNLSYSIKSINNNYYKCVVSFQMDHNTKSIKLTSNKMFATELFYKDNLIDVLINPNDYNDYYIGFDID